MSSQPLRRLQVVPPALAHLSASSQPRPELDGASPARGIVIALGLSSLAWIGLAAILV